MTTIVMGVKATVSSRWVQNLAHVHNPCCDSATIQWFQAFAQSSRSLIFPGGTVTRPTAISVNRRLPLGLALLLITLIAIIGSFAGPIAAHAAECKVDTATACVRGIIKTSDS